MQSELRYPCVVGRQLKRAQVLRYHVAAAPAREGQGRSLLLGWGRRSPLTAVSAPLTS